MSRHALRRFFTRLLPLALPLLGACAPCPLHSYTVTLDAGADTDASCIALCAPNGGTRVSTCDVADGGGLVVCKYNLCEGRRPHGFVPRQRERFARMAELEAASVHAFRILAAELREHGAPASLIDAARRSARDEARHARLMGALAGGRPRLVKPIRRTRSLDAIAVENVREGCVRETFGAALAQLEARTHADERVRRAMASIYPDEERHAELAHAVDRWIRPKLSRAARRRVDEARQIALDELRAEAPALRPLVDALAAVT